MLEIAGGIILAIVGLWLLRYVGRFLMEVFAGMVDEHERSQYRQKKKVDEKN